MAKKPASMEQLGMVLDGAAQLAQRGQLYDDVCLEIRSLIADGDLDPKRQAGAIQQARSLAAVIDRASGLSGRKQETYALGGLHKELREIRAELHGKVAGGDALEQLVAALGQTDETPDDGAGE